MLKVPQDSSFRVNCSIIVNVIGYWLLKSSVPVLVVVITVQIYMFLQLYDTVQPCIFPTKDICCWFGRVMHSLAVDKVDRSYWLNEADEKLSQNISTFSIFGVVVWVLGSITDCWIDLSSGIIGACDTCGIHVVLPGISILIALVLIISQFVLIGFPMLYYDACILGLMTMGYLCIIRLPMVPVSSSWYLLLSYCFDQSSATILSMSSDIILLCSSIDICCGNIGYGDLSIGLGVLGISISPIMSKIESQGISCIFQAIGRHSQISFQSKTVDIERLNEPTMVDSCQMSQFLRSLRRFLTLFVNFLGINFLMSMVALPISQFRSDTVIIRLVTSSKYMWKCHNEQQISQLMGLFISNLLSYVCPRNLQENVGLIWLRVCECR